MRWFMVVALVCAARTAHAGASDVGVVAYGEPSLQTEVAKRFERWLGDHGHHVVDAPLSADAITTLANCLTIDDLVCARSVFDARAKTKNLIYVGIAKGDTDVTFTVYLFSTGKEAVAERRVCEKCQGTKWFRVADTMLDRLTADTGLRPPPKKQSRLGPTIVLGAGVATMATGAVFLYYGSLDGKDQKYIYPDSTPIGIALGTVGLGAVIGGAIWLWQTGSPAQSGPVATATREGAYLGWAGQF